MSPLFRFFTLTYVVSWACFLAAAAVQRMVSTGGELPVFATALLLVGTVAPALVALAMTAWSSESDGVSALVDRIFEWQAGARWFAFAVGYMAAVKLAATLLHRVALGAWPRFGDTPWYLLAAAVVVSTPVQAGEEIGWRGYALPRLAARLGFARGSVLLGIIWAFWHVPLFFIRGVDNYGQSIPLFVAAVAALSVAMAWLYVQTGGSLLLTMLMHSAVNQTTLVVPSAVPTAASPFALHASAIGWMTVVLLWIPAAYFLARMRHIEMPRRQAEPATLL